MGKWDFACEDCGAAYYADTKKDADYKAKAHTQMTGHTDFHSAILPADFTTRKDKPVKVDGERRFTFEISEHELKIVNRALKNDESIFRFSYEDLTGADIIKSWCERFDKALNVKAGDSGAHL